MFLKIFSLLLLLFMTSHAQEQKAQVWQSDIQEAFEIAKKGDKKLFVMVSEDHCRWCFRMKNEALSDPRVQKMLEKYILVSIKRSDKASVAYVESFDGVIPSFFLMGNNQEEIESIIGYFKVDDFLGYLGEIEE
jgi:thioredoxin-related protein